MRLDRQEGAASDGHDEPFSGIALGGFEASNKNNRGLWETNIGRAAILQRARENEIT